MKTYMTLMLMFVLILCLLGCSEKRRDNIGQSEISLDVDQLKRLASRLSVTTLAVAVASEGHSFFDNFLPTARRGVISYYNTNSGRHATFHGCDLGDGVVINGQGELKWVGPNLSPDRHTITTIVWGGELAAVIDGKAEVRITDFVIKDINITTDSSPAQLQLDSLRIQLWNDVISVGDSTLPNQIFNPSGMDINSIPNPTKSLSTLTEADVKRLVYHGAVYLAQFLMNETLEIQRGDHTHELPCGRSDVTANLATLLPHIDNTWSQCDIGSGLFMDGAFSLDWAQLDLNAGVMTMIVEGNLTIGGGIPIITIKRMEWAVTGPSSWPGQIRIAGTIEGERDQRSYSFEVFVDD